MADATAPVLLVVGGDPKRLQWLTHHVTSHWPNAQVTMAPAEDPIQLAALVHERAPDAVILQLDFGDESAARFQREYEIISSIAHRAIAEIYDFGTLADYKYLAMEYIPCGDLRDRLRNPLSLEESLYYLRSIAEALRVIHVFGILHRDLKPANVMLREDNSPVLIDFGLARRSLDDAGTTGIGQVLGSPYYISP